MRKTHSVNIHEYSIEAKFLKVESNQIIKIITDSSLSSMRKHLVDVPTDKLSKVPSDSITGCLNRLLGVDDDDDDSQVINKNDASVRKMEKYLMDDDSHRYIISAEIAELSDFSHEENIISSQPPNLLLAMLTVEGKKWSSADYVRTYLNNVLSDSASRIKFVHALQSSDENGYFQSLAHCFTCTAYFLYLRRYWPMEMFQSKKTSALRLSKVSLGTSFSVIVLSPIVFGIIKKQAEITRTHQNKSNATISTRPEKEEEEQPRERDLSGFPVYQLQTSMRVGPTVMDYKEDANIFFNWKSCLREELIFRSLLFRSLLGYVHPAWACLLCTISSTLSYDCFYSEMYSDLDVSHAWSLKFVESFLLTSLSYVSLSVLPCLWVKALLSWDSTDFLTLGDPLQNRGLLMKKILKVLNLVGLEPLPPQILAHPENITEDSLKQLAEAVMSEYSSPFDGGIDSARRKLTAREREDFIRALEWACSSEVVNAMMQDEKSRTLPSTPLNYVSPLSSPADYCRSSTLLNLLTPPACNSKVPKLWALAMEKIFPAGSSSSTTTTATTTTTTTTTPNATAITTAATTARGSDRFDLYDGPDVDPMCSNSKEFISSQFQLMLNHELFYNSTNDQSVTQDKVEAMLLSALSESGAGVPASTLLPSLSRSLFYASNMDSNAFVSLMRDKHAFSSRIMDYYAPRIKSEFVKFYYHRYITGCHLSDEKRSEMCRDIVYRISLVVAKADDIFLRSRGLTASRYRALLNKHSLNPEVKALQKEFDEHVAKKRENIIIS